MIIAGAGLAAAAALAVPAWRHLHEAPAPPPPALRLAFEPDPDVSPGAADQPFGLLLGPDGRRAIVSAARGSVCQLWVRDLTTGETTPLTGTEDGRLPFWSRDGRQVGFFAAGRLKALSLDTGQIADLADAPAPRGGAWDQHGNVIFAPRDEGGLMRRRADDSSVEPLTALDANAGETSHRFPAVLDDGVHVVFFVRANEAQRSGIWIARLDNPQTRARLVGSPASGLVSGDWLVYGRDDAVLAQRLMSEDGSPLPALAGRPVLLGTPVGHSPLQQLSASVTADLLVFGAPQPLLRDLRWIERDNATMSTLASGIEAWDVRVSPNGGRVAVTARDPQLGTLDIEVYEGARPLPRRISQAIGADESAVWSQDGSRLAWVQTQRMIAMRPSTIAQGGLSNVEGRGALAQLPEQTIRKFEMPIRLWDWSPDGQRLLIGYSRPGTRDDIFAIAANGTGDAVPYAQSAFNETYAAVSPDGQWLAYASDESGQPEIYLDAFPTPGRRARLTVGGGTEPRFARAGQGVEVFFRRGSEIHVVAVSFAEARPAATSTTRVADAGGEVRSFDVTSDGRRLLVNVPSPGARPQPIAALVNWRSILR